MSETDVEPRTELLVRALRQGGFLVCGIEPYGHGDPIVARELAAFSRLYEATDYVHRALLAFDTPDVSDSKDP